MRRSLTISKSLLDEKEWHRKSAIDCFDLAWTLIDKMERTQEDSDWLMHAGRCLEICEKNGIGDFDVAFAHEAVARASAVAGRTDDCRKHSELAQAAGRMMKDQGDRDYFLGELKTVSC